MNLLATNPQELSSAPDAGEFGAAPQPPRQLDNPDHDPKNALEMVRERFGVAEAYDRPWKEQCIRNWEIVNDILPQNWPYFSEFMDPMTSTACTDAVEGVMMQLFPRDRYFDLKPEEEQDELATALMRTMMTTVLRRRVRYKQLVYGQSWENVVFGNGIVEWVARPFVDRARYGLMGGAEQQKIEVWPSAENVRRVDFFPGPTGATPHLMPYCIRRKLVTMDALMMLPWARQLSASDVEKLKTSAWSVDAGLGRATHGGEPRTDLWTFMRAAGYEVGGGTPTGGERGVKYVELLYYWQAGPHGDGCDRLIITNNDFTVKCFDGPEPTGTGQKPFASIGFWYMGPGVFQARGLPDVAEKVQWQLDSRNAQFHEQIELILRPRRIVNKARLSADLSRLQDNYPGEVIEAGEFTPDVLRDLDEKRTPLELMKDMDSLRASHNRLTKQTDVGRGMIGRDSVMGKGTETMGGMAQMLKTQNRASLFKWMLQEEGGLKDGLQLCAEILQGTMTVPQVVEVMGRDPVLERLGLTAGRVMIRPEDIQGKWDFFAVGTTQSMDDVDQAALVERWFTAALQVPGFADENNLLEATYDVAEMFGIRNPRRWRLSPEEMAQKKQDALQQQLKAISQQLQFRQGKRQLPAGVPQ